MPLPSFDEVKQQALSLGWDDVALTRPQIPEADIQAYRSWLADGMHGQLDYMENQLRCAPEELLPGARTVFLFVSNYKKPLFPFKKEAGLVASYARGRDYHNIHRKRLKKMHRWLESVVGEPVPFKGFSDSTPILEKALAVQAGLGWFGKNTLLIHRRFGTFILLSGMLTTLEFPLAPPVKEMRLPRCGSCRKCLDACPTGALVAPYQLDAQRCLSNHLIESKEPIPEKIQQQNPGYLFGCDLCQDSCPHNVRSPLALHPDFTQEVIGPYVTLEDLQEIREKPERLYGTPLQRRKIEGLLYTATTLWPSSE